MIEGQRMNSENLRSSSFIELSGFVVIKMNLLQLSTYPY